MHYTGAVRFVERYVGSLICFFFTLIHRLRRKPSDKTVRKILVIELVEMGAAVMAYSSLRHIKQMLPNAEIHCLCLASKKDSWQMLDLIPKGNVHVLDDSNLRALFFSILSQAYHLSKKKFDIIIDYELFLRISAIIAYLIRAKFRAGYFRYTMEGMYRGDFYDIRCNFNQNMHIAKNHLALTKSAIALSESHYNYAGKIENDEIVVPVYSSDTHLKEKMSARLQELGHKGEQLIIVAPTVGHALSVRDYPKDAYVSVVQKLIVAYPTHRIVLVGTSEHRAICEYVNSRTGGRCINMAGGTDTLPELVEIFALGSLLISNDSGNPHFAAMVGLPTLAIFGPETPFLYGPLGKAVCLFEFFHTSPSITAYNHKNPPIREDPSLRAISPERVVAAASTILEGKAKYGTVNNEIPYIV
ncbi:glycosyltransferase family 9 protein [Candidatus Kaiserbacteria bacterium]|nr:glycosyltransferase family 9 protein [Candidatus Kaiserbacteria bacterium]